MTPAAGQQAEVDAERQRITEAMLDLCFERGYKNLTLPLLLERAGVEEDSFHRHFADLEDCFCAVYLEAREDFLGKVEGAIAAQLSWRDRIRATAYVLLYSLREDPKVTHLGTIEVRSAGERPQLLLAEAVQRLFDLLDEGRDELEDTDALTRTTAEAVGGGIFSQVYAAIEHGILDRAEDLVPQMMYAAVLPYLGPEAALEELKIPPPEQIGGEAD